LKFGEPGEFDSSGLLGKHSSMIAGQKIPSTHLLRGNNPPMLNGPRAVLFSS